MAQLFGFILPAQAQELIQRVEEAERELVQSRATISSLGSLRDAIGNIDFGGDSSNSSSVADVGVTRSDGLLEESVEESAGSDSETAESSDEQRSDDVRNTNVIDPFADIRI
jgi:hypothetical protein